MAEARKLDITNEPALQALAREVHANRRQVVLIEDGREVAVVNPLPAKSVSPSRARPVTEGDAVLDLVGIGNSGTPGGWSARKHELLLQANRRKRS